MFFYCSYCNLLFNNYISINKQWLEANGQASMFGHDNLSFKTVNHPIRHKFVELCPEFKLKQLSNKLKLKLTYLST